MRITIDGIECQANVEETIIQVARRAGIEIPTLCYYEPFGGQGICRMCMVEVTVGGRQRLVASCTYPITAEIEVHTSTPAIEKIRRNLVLLLYRRAPKSDYMQELYQKYGAPEIIPTDPEERCIMCRLCVSACKQVESSAISAVSRGIDKRIGTPYDASSPDCIGCGACVQVCPTGAIEVRENEGQREIWHQSFTLASCERCGRPLPPQPLLDRVRGKLSTTISEQDFCHDCRRKENARKFAECKLTR